MGAEEEMIRGDGPTGAEGGRDGEPRSAEHSAEQQGLMPAADRRVEIPAVYGYMQRWGRADAAFFPLAQPEPFFQPFQQPGLEQRCHGFREPLSQADGSQPYPT